MIERNHAFGIFEVSCDGCPSETRDFDCDMGWQAMIDDLKSEGWTIFKGGDDEWEHHCPACSEPDDIEDIIENFPGSEGHV